MKTTNLFPSIASQAISCTPTLPTLPKLYLDPQVVVG